MADAFPSVLGVDVAAWTSERMWCGSDENGFEMDPWSG
jgi:hypothetical protein